MSYFVDYSTTPEIRADQRPLSIAGPRQTIVWLAIFLLLCGGAGMHMLYRHDVHQLRQQLVATQHSFAGLSEESVQHLQRLEERTADWAEMQSRVLGVSVQLDSLQQQLSAVTEAVSSWKTLDTAQAKQAEQLQLLAEQATAVEEAALTLDAQQQRLQTRLNEQDTALKAQLESLSALVAGLEKQLVTQQKKLQEDNQQLSVLAEQLHSWQAHLDTQAQDGERFAQLQESVLKLAQQVKSEQEERERLGQEMSAFRLQVTRTQNSLREQVDALRN